MMAGVPLEAGRVGDVWHIEGKDQLVHVVDVDNRSIGIRRAADESRSVEGFPFAEWQYSLYRLREEPANLRAGGTAHLYVPPTSVYILDVIVDEDFPLLGSWFTFPVGVPPTPEIRDSGIYFHPMMDPSLNFELRYRPYPELCSGAAVEDVTGKRWDFHPPFHFTDSTGQKGIPRWPLRVPSEEDGVVAGTAAGSHKSVLAAWAGVAGVDVSVFDIEWPDWDE